MQKEIKCDVCGDIFSPDKNTELRVGYNNYTSCPKCIIDKAKETHCPYAYQIDEFETPCSHEKCLFDPCPDDIWDDCMDVPKREYGIKLAKVTAEYLRRRNEDSNSGVG